MIDSNKTLVLGEVEQDNTILPVMVANNELPVASSAGISSVIKNFNIRLGLAVSGKARKKLGEMPPINRRKWTSDATTLDVIWEQGPLSSFLHPS